jgi:integrase/recombinase XerC
VLDLVEQFLSRRSAHTRRAYDGDLRHFAEFIGEPTPVAAVTRLIECGPAQANLTALQYQRAMTEAGTTPATRNRRLSAIRSALKLGRTLGLLAWSIEIEGEKVRPYKDTAGCGVDAYKAMLSAANVRDQAILHLAFDLGLRRGEIVELDVGHVNLAKRRLSIKGKGRTEREALALPLPTCKALSAWLDERGRQDGPLFTSYRHSRLTPNGILHVIRQLGKAVGLQDLHPHQLRHCSITEAVRLTHGDLVAVQSFARHANPRTTAAYVDNARDLAGRTAVLLAESTNDTPNGEEGIHAVEQ